MAGAIDAGVGMGVAVTPRARGRSVELLTTFSCWGSGELLAAIVSGTEFGCRGCRPVHRVVLITTLFLFGKELSYSICNCGPVQVHVDGCR
jgi:hypothetical protein